MNKKAPWLNSLHAFTALLLIACFVIHQYLLTPQESYRKFIEKHPFYRAIENSGSLPELNINEVDDDIKTDRPDLAAEQDFILTMDPQLGRPAPERLVSALALMKSYASLKKVPGEQISPWVERGPDNVGGRTRTLVWDPNDTLHKKVWAGSVGGGLWYNENLEDNNSSWKAVNNFMQNLSVSCMAFDPSNSMIAYIGTGEGWNLSSSGYSGTIGAGIWKTINGGKTWNVLPSSASFLYINDIAVRNENDTSVIYAAVDGSKAYGLYHGTSSAGLQRSVNGGLTWSQVLPVMPTLTANYVAADIEIDGGNRLWAGTKYYPDGSGYGGGYVLYSDNGTDWVTSYIGGVSAGSGRVEIACAPSDPKVIYAAIENGSKINKIVKSIDSGSTWGLISLPVDADNGIASTDFTRSQAWYDLIMAVDPNNAERLLIGGVDLFYSKNGGSNWAQVSKWSNSSGLSLLPCAFVHADQHAIAFQPGSSSTVIFGNDGGIFLTNSIAEANTSNVIESRNNNYNVTQFYSCAIHPEAGNDFYLAGAQDNGTQRFTLPGLGSTVSAYGGDGGYCFIDQKIPDYQIAAYTNNNFFLSVDGGQSFYTKLVGQSTGLFINPADYDDNLHILYSSNNSSSLLKISDITQSPTTLQNLPVPPMNGQATHIRVSPYSTASSTVFAGTVNGNLIKIKQANLSPIITKLNVSGLPKGSVSCIEIGASEDELLVTFYNYGITSVWYTNNGGVSWKNKEGNLPDMPVRWALFNPDHSNQVILATELGVWSTLNLFDSVPTWVPSNYGMGNVRVDMFQMRSSDRQVIAATHGRGLFSSNAFTWPASIKKIDKSTELKVYPNPSSTEFMIEFYSEDNNDVQLELFDLNGKSVFSNTFSGFGNGFNKIKVEPAGLKSGTYLLRITGNKNYYKFKKIIIQ